MQNKKLPYLLGCETEMSLATLRDFLDKMNQWRQFLYRVFSQYAPTSGKDTSEKIDELIKILILLERCKISYAVNVSFKEMDDAKEYSLSAILHFIQERMRCPILKSLFSPVSTKNHTYPSLFFQRQWDVRIRRTISSALATEIQNFPLLFGEYHQFTLANPIIGTQKTSRTSNLRHSRGSHYTPAFIVDYLTAQTMDAAIQGIVNINDIRVYDPSCGSGVFLIAAFRYFVRHTEKQALNADSLLNFIQKKEITIL